VSSASRLLGQLLTSLVSTLVRYASGLTPCSQVELVGVELLRAPAELHPLQLAEQVAQPVILPGELVALFDQPRLLGPLGIALSPRRQHQGAQRGDVAGKALLCRDDRDYRTSPVPRDPST
jgi:hypothetical protein